MRNLIILSISLLISSTISLGQVKITGMVKDSANAPLAQATLKLQKDSNTAIQMVSSDSTGSFTFSGLTAGSYTIEGSYVGAKGTSSHFILNKDTFIVIRVNSRSITLLQEVTVKENKPLIERKIDRMVFNIDNSIAAKGMDLTQALEMTPLLRVDANSVSIIGKSGVSVMIDGRMLQLSGADLMNYLRSLRSDNVSRIEIITTPPAKYEAQGNSGLINIVLKKNPNMGWSGNMSSSYQQNTYPGYANNFNLNFQSHKLSSSLKLRQYHRMASLTDAIDIIGASSILSDNIRKSRVYGLGANLSTDYKISKTSSIGFIYDIGDLHDNSDVWDISTYLTKNSLDSVLTTSARRRSPTLTHMINVYHDLKLDTTGKMLSSGFNFFTTTPRSTVDFQTISDKAPAAESVRNTSNFGYTIWSVQSDLTLPYRWAVIETGAKFTNFDNHSDVGYYDLVQESYQIDSSKSNTFKYNEKNIAGYISAQKDLNPKWSAKAGLRYEYSIIDGYSPATGERSRFEYGKLFPSAYVAYKPNKANTFSLTYSKRINRPNFRMLNPFRWYSNPYTYYTGNPLLQPSFNHNIELSYLYKGIFSVSLYGQKTINGYGSVVEVNNAVKVIDFKNYLTQYNTGLQATFGQKLFPWWESRVLMNLSYSTASSSIEEVLTQKGFAFNYSTYNTFVVCKTITTFLNFWHSLPANEANVHRGRQYTLSSGVRIALAKEKVQVNISGDDIFRTSENRGKIYFQDFTQYFSSYYDSRRFSLSVTYTFGNARVKGNRKQVNFRETQRAN